MELARQQAEEGRNYTNAFVGTGQMGAPGTTGSEGGAGSIYDPNAALPAVDWSGPAAYGMSPVGAEFGPGNEAAMYAALARAQQFDPTASLVQGMRTTGGEGGGIDQTYYTLNYDPSKVPQPMYSGAANVGNYGSNESVYDESRLFYDPNYGVMTDPRNLKGDQGFDWLGVLGPAAVGGFAFGIPAVAAGLGVTGAAAGAAPFAGLSAAEAGPGAAAGVGSQAAGSVPWYGYAGGTSMPWYGNAGLSTAKQIGNEQFNPYAFVTSWSPGLANFGLSPAAAGAIGYGSQLAGTYSGYERSREQRSGYNPQNYGKMNQPLSNAVIDTDNQPVATMHTGNAPYNYYGFGDKGQ